MTTEHSGVDLARQALIAAREAAKRSGGARKEKPRRRTQTVRRDGREPLGLAAAIQMMMTERGLAAPAAGGSVLACWDDIVRATVPELVGHGHAVRFDADTGRLDVAPASPAYGTKLRWSAPRLITEANKRVPGANVRTLHVLPPAPGTAGSPVAADPQPPAATSAPADPVRTRETASAGYHRTRAELLAHKAEQQVDPEIQAVIDRHTASPRMREPEHLFGNGQAATDDLRTRMTALRSAAEEAERTVAKEVTHARALRRLQEERAGLVPQETSTPLGRTA